MISIERNTNSVERRADSYQVKRAERRIQEPEDRIQETGAYRKMANMRVSAQMVYKNEVLTFFCQNEANVREAKISVTSSLTKAYAKNHIFGVWRNKANSSLS